MNLPKNNPNSQTDKSLNYCQTKYFCEVCKANHFGNCPKMKVTTTYSKNVEQDKSLDEIDVLLSEIIPINTYDPDYVKLNKIDARNSYKNTILALKQKWEREARIDEVERADSIYNEDCTPLWQYFKDRIKELGDK